MEKKKYLDKCEELYKKALQDEEVRLALHVLQVQYDIEQGPAEGEKE